MNIKRIVSIVLILTLLLSFSSCQGEDISSTSSGPALSSEPSSEEPSSEEPSSEEPLSEEPSSEEPSSEEPSSEEPSSEEPSSEEPSSEEPSSEKPSSEEPSSEEPSSEEPSSEEPSSEDVSEEILLYDKPQDMEKFLTVYTPDREEKQTYSKDGLSLYNTDFRLSETLEAEIQALIADFPHTASVVMKELDSGMMITYNPKKRIATASAIKAPYALYTVKAIESGMVDWSYKMPYEEKHYSPNGTGYIQTYEYGTIFSIKRLMELTIILSDNVGYYMLKDALGTEYFEVMLDALDCSRMIPTGANWGYTSGLDLVRIWEEIYFTRNSSEYSKRLYEVLCDAYYSCIKPALPQYESLHKSGWSSIAYNEAGIVYIGGHPYALAVLTTRTDVRDGRNPSFMTSMIELLGKVAEEYNAYNG